MNNVKLNDEQIKKAIDTFKKLKETGVFLCSYCIKASHCTCTNLLFTTNNIKVQNKIDFCSDFKEDK